MLYDQTILFRVYDGVLKSKSIPENSTTSIGRFYGQPTSCSDLSQLGYTLNGFYVVKSNNESTNSSEIKLDNVFCAFKQPESAFNSSLVENRIIPRRETKPSSGKLLYFHGTMKIDSGFHPSQMSPITFDGVNVNVVNAFDAATGIFTAPRSGLYLFIFRGRVISRNLREFVINGINQMGWIYYAKNYFVIGRVSITLEWNINTFADVEFDKLINLNREDKISVGSQIIQPNETLDFPRFSAYSTSFKVYFIEEEI